MRQLLEVPAWIPDHRLSGDFFDAALQNLQGRQMHGLLNYEITPQNSK
jgi:hypothetical protein